MRTATCPPCRTGSHEDCWIACGCPDCHALARDIAEDRAEHQDREVGR